MTRGRRGLIVAFLALAPVVAACGQKGPPRPPLRAVPVGATEMRARRVDTTVHLSFRVPSVSQDAEAPLSLDRVDVYARSGLVGQPSLTINDIVRRDYLVGSVAIAPPADPDQPAPDPALPADDRPKPGEIATFTEVLPSPAGPVATGAPARSPVPLIVPPATVVVPFLPPPVTVRYYVLVGVTSRGRNGVASARLPVRLAGAPEAPTDARLDHTDTTLILTWTAPPGAPVAVYDATSDGAASVEPVQVAPITTGTWSSPVVFGQQRCFVVRRVRVDGTVSTESAAAGPVCRTPQDTYPPAAPTNLRGVAEPGRVTVEWTSVVAADLAGYIVLRGDGATPTLRPLMTDPVATNVYADTTAQPGVAYAYAVVAVDRAGNRSAQSAPVSVTGRDAREPGR